MFIYQGVMTLDSHQNFLIYARIWKRKALYIYYPCIQRTIGWHSGIKAESTQTLHWKIGSVYMGLVTTKPVFGVSHKARQKPGSSATEISQKIENLLVTILVIILSYKRITKALIRLPRCAGWSAPLLFANLRRQIFSRRDPFYNTIKQV